MTQETAPDGPVQAFARRLAEQAAARGLTVALAARSGVAAGGASGVEVTAGQHAITVWPGGGGAVRIEVATVSEAWRVITPGVAIPADDASAGALVTLLEGGGRLVVRWWKLRDELVVAHAGTRLALPAERTTVAGPRGAEAEAAARAETAGLVDRLAAEAARQGLDVTFAVSPDSGFGWEFIPRIDVTAGADSAKVWPEGEENLWVEASVVLGSGARCVAASQYDDDVWLNDDTIRRLIALLRGEGRIVRGCLFCGEGKTGLWLSVQDPVSFRVRVLSGHPWRRDAPPDASEPAPEPPSEVR